MNVSKTNLMMPIAYGLPAFFFNKVMPEIIHLHHCIINLQTIL